MDSQIKTCYAFIDGHANNISATELRGFLGYLFANDPEFHHHSNNSFHYPLVQYKKVHGKLLVIGLNDYAEKVFEKMSQLENIITPQDKIKISNIDMMRTKFDIHEEYSVYRFISPWIALNEKNYGKFKVLDKQGRKELLEQILIGNFLSALKGLGITIDFEISVNINRVKQKKTKAHENEFVGFFSEFVTNVAIPKYLGLGKSVSKGFGIIERIK